jgi:hypothetical protein
MAPLPGSNRIGLAPEPDPPGAGLHLVELVREAVLLALVPAEVMPGEADGKLCAARVQSPRAGFLSAVDPCRSDPDLADQPAVAILLVPLDAGLLPITMRRSDCLERSANGWPFSGASMPARRILCWTLVASSTVIVSPSATPTTRASKECVAACAAKPGSARNQKRRVRRCTSRSGRFSGRPPGSPRARRRRASTPPVREPDA